MRRTKTYDEELSQRLKNPKYAQAFLEALIEGEEGLSVEEALRHLINIMGVKEFSLHTKTTAPNIVAFVKKRRHLKTYTLNHLLKPFKLRAKLIFEKVA